MERKNIFWKVLCFIWNIECTIWSVCRQADLPGKPLEQFGFTLIAFRQKQQEVCFFSGKKLFWGRIFSVLKNYSVWNRLRGFFKIQKMAEKQKILAKSIQRKLIFSHFQSKKAVLKTGQICFKIHENGQKGCFFKYGKICAARKAVPSKRNSNFEECGNGKTKQINGRIILYAKTKQPAQWLPGR